MQFIQNGPDIPDALLQAHEEGRVVFFCGAGISRPAGLPDFGGLVDALYCHVGEYRNELEAARINGGQLDQAIGLFEQRIQGGRKNVRSRLPQILQPDLTKRHALTSHLALLTLGRNRDHGLRLVTTNFDTLFETAANHYSLPRLTIYPDPPARSSWEGVVHLHGRMPDSATEDELNNLILSDGDFGHAYLTQGWAARFVATLFHDFTLCFVGYGIDDPVLRYMTAAHALGKGTPEMFAFAAFSEGQKDSQTKAWHAKNVTPILYDDAHSHRQLHQTLRVWASIHRDGVRGRERIVSRLARRQPSRSTSENDFVGRMLWALSDDSGLPAKCFAEFDPVPSLDWLSALNEDRYGSADLPRFGLSAHTRKNDKLAFCLVRRPAPYDLAPRMTLVSGYGSSGRWDKVMFQLARWLTRHLDDPALLLWLAEHGGKLHDQLIDLIESELDRLARLEHDGNTPELERIRGSAPNAIPRPQMRTLWQLLLSGRVKSHPHKHNPYPWFDRLQQNGLNTPLRLELRALLTPMVTLRKPFSWGEAGTNESTGDDLTRHIDWQFELADDNIDSFLDDLRQSDAWQVALPALVNDFQHLLRDALDLRHEFGEACEREDPSHSQLPSLHTQRHTPGFREWIALVELLRDAWLATHRGNPTRARQIVLDWFTQPYLTFRRLGLFAAAHENLGLLDAWVDCLLANDSRYLWIEETQLETKDLLEQQGARLSDSARTRLETAILNGPPRALFRLDTATEQVVKYSEKMIQDHLASLTSGGGHLSEAAHARFAELSAAANARSDTPPLGMGSGYQDFESLRKISRAPRTRRDLAKWLKDKQTKGFFDEDNWRETCSERFFASAFTLCDLAREGQWPAQRWREALQAWSDEKLAKRAWHFLAPTLQTMPDAVLFKIIPTLTWWLKVAATVLDKHDTIFLTLCRRVLAQPNEDGLNRDQPVGQAINHPVGHVTQALLDFWFRRDPNDNNGLPEDLGPLLTQLCNTSIPQYRHGRVVLASRLITLFRVDRTWTQAHLLPLFDWSHPDEARAVWEGFLWSPRLHRPLLLVFKSSFLETARRYIDLGDHARQYAALLTYAALDLADVFTPKELYDTFSTLPQNGLQEAAQALVRAQEASGEQREQCWTNRIQPFWQEVWPKSGHMACAGIAEKLARLSIAAKGEFPAALAAVKYWLQPLQHPDYVVRCLQESGLCTRFPQDALQLMAAVIDEQSWAPRNLGDSLKAVVQAWPDARHDVSYQRLEDYLRTRS